MRQGTGQSSSSSHNNNLKQSREEQQSYFKAKHIGSGEQQGSRELMRRSDEMQGHVPVYRVTKAKFQKSNLRYSENSPLKLREKGVLSSPYRQQEFEAYNFGHLSPLDPFEHRGKGRCYFYKRREERKQQDEEEASRLSDFVKPHTVVLNKQQQTEPRARAELTLQEMHYEMVKAFQKCRHAQHF